MTDDTTAFPALTSATMTFTYADGRTQTITIDEPAWMHGFYVDSIESDNDLPVGVEQKVLRLPSLHNLTARIFGAKTWTVTETAGEAKP